MMEKSSNYFYGTMQVIVNIYWTTDKRGGGLRLTALLSERVNKTVKVMISF